MQPQQPCHLHHTWYTLDPPLTLVGMQPVRQAVFHIRLRFSRETFGNSRERHCSLLSYEDARAAASWLPQAYDGTHLPRVRTALSGFQAGWNRACASRPARNPSPPCLLTPHCICSTVRRLHSARLVGGADDGAEAQDQWLLMWL